MIRRRAFFRIQLEPLPLLKQGKAMAARLDHSWLLLIMLAIVSGCVSVKVDSVPCPKNDEMLVGAPAIDELKRWKLFWLHWESGGILLLPALEENDAMREYARLIGRMPNGDEDEAWLVDQDALNERIAARLKNFFAKGQLAPGTYSISNQFREQAFEGEIQQNSNDPGRSIVVPDSETIEFAFTDEHLALIRVMNTRTRTLPAVIEIMDVKRPYGDMTYYFADMADALGEPVASDETGRIVPFDADRIERYETLHGEMLFAVRAFLDHAVCPEGK